MVFFSEMKTTPLHTASNPTPPRKASNFLPWDNKENEKGNERQDAHDARL